MFLCSNARINGHLFGVCGIRKADVPEVPEFKNKKIADVIPGEPSWETLHRAADAQVPKMMNDIIDTTEAMKNGVNLAEMERAISANDKYRITTTIPYGAYEEGLKNTAEDSVKIAFNKAGAGMIIHLPEAWRDFKFDTTTDRAKKYTTSQGAKLVRQVTDETKKAINAEIVSGLKSGLGPDVVAKNIKNIVGLTQRQAGAVTRFWQAQRNAGISDAQAFRNAKLYSERLLKLRAENIARTETMKAANEGHLEMLQQGVEDGFIPEDIVRVWIVTPDDRLCPYCLPMEGKTTGLKEPFKTPRGDFMTPPLHPQCRCVTGIERMKTTAKPKAPKVPKEPKVPKPPKVVKPSKNSIKEFEDSIKSNKFETAGLYHPKGMLILDKRGGKSSVSFSGNEVSLMKGNILTHNHPNGSSFSPADINMLNVADLSEIRAVATDRDYVLKRIPGREMDFKYADSRKINALYKRAGMQTHNEYLELVKGGMSTDEAWMEQSHSMIKEVSSKLGLDYQRILKVVKMNKEMEKIEKKDTKKTDAEIERDYLKYIKDQEEKIYIDGKEI